MKTKRGQPILERRRGGVTVRRWRSRRKVLVHRLVKIKAIAEAMGGIRWRLYVQDLPPGIDVNHIGRRDQNVSHLLELQTERANRERREMTDEEWEQLRAAF